MEMQRKHYLTEKYRKYCILEIIKASIIFIAVAAITFLLK